MSEDTPQLHIDSDWKAEAQAEKERLAAEEATAAEAAGAGPGGPGQLPEANFRTLMSMLASQALMGLGTMADPDNKGVLVDLDGSKLAIDLLAVLEEKTENNLTDEEAGDLRGILTELRARFVEITKALAQQAPSPGAGPAGPMPDLRTPEG